MRQLLRRSCYNAVVHKEEGQCQGSIWFQVVCGTPCDVTQHTSLSPRAANWNIVTVTQNKTGSSQHVTSDNGVSQGQMGIAR